MKIFYGFLNRVFNCKIYFNELKVKQEPKKLSVCLKKYKQNIRLEKKNQTP